MNRVTNRARSFSILVLAGIALGMIGFLPFSKIPTHPIDFSHRIHAGVNQIPCQYCHLGARRSSSAVIPPEERCMGCHKIVAQESPEIAKLKEYYERGEPIAWVRFFKLPEFSYFRHHPHIAAQVECQRCHGPVQTYDRFREAPFMEMGWCLECHIERNANRDCYACHR